MDLPVHAGFFDGWSDAPEHSDDFDCEWVQNLVALVRAADATSTGFAKSRGVVKGQSVDKGGNTNLFKENSRSPDCNLVVDGWRVFERFRPNEAKGTEGGVFHAFLQCVYEYATGNEAESHSGVTTWIKTLAGPLRDLDDLLTERAAIVFALQHLASLAGDHEDEWFLRSQIERMDDAVLKQECRLAEAKPGKKLR